MGKCESRHLKYDAAGGWVKSHLEGQPAIWAIHYLGWGGGESSGPCSSTTTASTSTSATSTTLESSGSEGGKGNEGGWRWWQAVKGLGGEYPPRKSSFFSGQGFVHTGGGAPRIKFSHIVVVFNLDFWSTSHANKTSTICPQFEIGFLLPW